MSAKTVFGPGPDFSLNACVGDNTGSDDDYNYVLGFAQAALALVAIAKQQFYLDPTSGMEIVVYRDTLIYPICFNARHHVELFLKRQIQRVAKLRRATFDNAILAGHELGALLAELTRLCGIVDRRLTEFLTPLASSVEAFAAIDPTGQTFRYRRSLASALHLQELGHINLARLEETFTKLFDGTENFELLADALEYEYGQLTHTSELSRYELNQLAKALPQRSSWRKNPEFDEVKKDFTTRFGMSGKTFSRAVAVIEAHYEFASRIGIEIALPHVDPETLRKLVALELDTDRLDATSQTEWEALMAIAEVGHSDAYSELFSHRMLGLGRGDRSAVFAHDVVREITMASDRFRRGLVKLGQKTLLATFDAALASRKSETDDQAEERTIQEFNAEVRVHLFGHLRMLGKYASASTASDDGAGSARAEG